MAALLAAGGHRRAALLALVPAVVAVVLALVAPSLLHRSLGGVDRFGRFVGRAAVAVVAVVAAAVVVAPLWLVHALARTSPLADGWERPGGAWRTRSGRRGADGRLIAVERTGAVEPSLGPGERGGVRRRRVAAIAAIVVLVGGAAYVWGEQSRRQQQAELFGAEVSMRAHQEEPWFRAHAREMVEIPYRWDPFLGALLGDYEGDTLHIVDGRRVTYQPAGPPDLTVWYFGGSTMFGAGQRDEATIPSVIASLAERDGLRIRSVNYGVSSLVNWQETMLLQQELQLRDPPDLIVFYDGVNEEAAATMRVQRGAVDPEAIDRPLVGPQEEELWRQNRPTATVPPAEQGELAIQLAARQYARGVDVARRLGEEHGVEVVHLWQPELSSKRPSAADLGTYEDLGLAPPEAGSPVVAREILERSGTGAIDLTSVLDDVTEPVFWDGGHTNELGAQVIAEAIYARLGPTFERLAQES